MMPIHLARKNGTNLVRVLADGDHGLDLLIQEFIQVLRPMLGDIDPNLFHRLNRQWMNVARWVRSRAPDFKKIFCSLAQNPLGHMTPAGVPGAEDEDDWFLWRGHSGPFCPFQQAGSWATEQQPFSCTQRHPGTASKAPRIGANR